MKQVAIVSRPEFLTEWEPFYDPGFEIWGAGEAFASIDRLAEFRRWFELRFLCLEDVAPETYRRWLREQTRVPVFMQRPVAGIPASTAYPKAEVLREFGPYFACPESWMVALAIHERFEKIHLYAGPEGRGCEFFLGICQGLGIEYYVPPSSGLLRVEKLYGYEEATEHERADHCRVAG